MKIRKFSTKSDWLANRRGKITGSKLGDLTPKRNGSGRRIGHYKLVADLVSLPPTEESQRDIGQRLEAEAIARFEKETGKKVDSSLVIWERQDDSGIAYSPDGFIIGKKIIHAQEAKCLSTERHIEAYLTQEIPSEYIEQTRQAFVVNDDLQLLSVIFYCPLIPAKDYFVIEVKRKDIEDEIEMYRKMELEVLADVRRIAGDLTF